MTILRIEQLSKSYGRLRALDRLDLSVQQGQVLGILGPNGSGKTTTLGLITGILRADSGRYTWFEGAMPEHVARRRMGILLETPNFYPWLSGLENLAVVAHIKRAATAPLPSLLERVGLQTRMHTPFRTYSLGMKQRLALAAALVGEPEVLILDEPTNGLDPEGIAEVRALIQQIASEGRTIIMASHILDEVEKLCSHVAILKSGRLLASGPVGSLLSDERELEVDATDREGLYALLHTLPEVRALERRNGLIVARIAPSLQAARVNELAFANGIVLTHLVERHKSLEEEFLQLVKEKEPSG